VEQLEIEPEEEEEAQERSRPGAVVIFETIRIEGEDELKRTTGSLAFSGFAAGLSMGLSLVAMGALMAHLPVGAVWREVISSFGYSVGYLVVVLGRQQLFTENTLTPVLHFLAKPKASVFAQVMRLWATVLAFNVVGAVLVGLVIAVPGVFTPDMRDAFDELARAAVASPPPIMFIHAVFAGWIIALMVWLLPLAETASPFIIIILTYVVALGGFSHIIAGSVEVAYGVARGIVPLDAYFWPFFGPTLLGNIVGGVLLVSLLSFAQVIGAKK
jgi:formate/nitrite transporter FocA (FNT family)